MILAWAEKAWKDYCYWQEQDRKPLKRINKLLEDIRRNRYEGIGDPEPLKDDLKECWSRRIDSKNRIVYTIEGDMAFILKCRSDYGDK